MTIRLFETFHYATQTDNVIQPPTAGQLQLDDHAVLIVGYDDRGLLVRNSWGRDWGDAGHARLPWAYADQHLTSAWTLQPEGTS